MPHFLRHVMNGEARPPARKPSSTFEQKLADATPALADLFRLEVELGHQIELDTNELLRQKLEEKRKKHDPNNKPSASNADNTMRMG